MTNNWEEITKVDINPLPSLIHNDDEELKEEWREAWQELSRKIAARNGEIDER